MGSESQIETKINVVILGGDISGPMAAAKLTRYLPKSLYDVTFICPPTIERAELFAHMPPSLKKVHRDLKIREVDFIRATAATFSLGTNIFETKRSFIPFGSLGPILKDTAFYHVVHCAGYDDIYQFNLSSRLAKEQKFLLPQSSGPILLSGFDYGYHVNVQAYAKLLTEKAMDMGCRLLMAETSEVERKGNNVSAVTLENGDKIVGDIFVDCSGSEAKLKASGDTNNWTAALDLPSRYTIETTKHRNEVLASASAMSFQSHECSVKFQTQTENVSMSFSNDDGRNLSGWLQEPWVSNVISMGLASFALPPLCGWNLRLIDEQIERLVKFMPSFNGETLLTNEYNRLSNGRIRAVIDYAILLYRVLDIETLNRAERWPTASYKYKYFKSRGRFATMDHDDDWKDEWIAMLLSRYGWPDDMNIMAQQVDVTVSRADLEDIEKTIQHIVKSAPTHREFIAKNCAIPEFIT